MNDISSTIRPSVAGLDALKRASRASALSCIDTFQGNDHMQPASVTEMLSKINELPPIRQDLVDQVKAQIADGTYETPDKINTAVKNLLQDFAGEYPN